MTALSFGNLTETDTFRAAGKRRTHAFRGNLVFEHNCHDSRRIDSTHKGDALLREGKGRYKNVGNSANF